MGLPAQGTGNASESWSRGQGELVTSSVITMVQCHCFPSAMPGKCRHLQEMAVALETAAVGCQQALQSLHLLLRGSQAPSSFLRSSLEVTGCHKWVPGQECLEANGSIDGGISGSLPPWTSRSMACISPTPSEPSEVTWKIKRAEGEINSFLVFV